MKRLGNVAMLLFLGVLLGMSWGVWRQRVYLRMETAAGMQGQEEMLDTFAKMQFTHAEPQVAREALLAAINVHKRVQDAYPDWSWTEKAKWGWCYADLALLEDSMGEADLARNHMLQAEEILKPLGYSRESIHEVLNRHAQARAQSAGGQP